MSLLRLVNPRILFKIQRHYKTLKHVTLKKLLNIVLVVIQMILHREKLYGYPFMIKVEACNFCNLRCKYCYAHDFNNPFPKGMMTYQTFQKIIDELGPYLFQVSLYLWGEPLINKEVPDMIAYASKRNIRVVISTNVHFIDKAVAEKLVMSGLDHAIVAIDGLTQETYEKVRIGGNLARALNNLQKLLTARRKLGGGGNHSGMAIYYYKGYPERSFASNRLCKNGRDRQDKFHSRWI